MIIRDTLRQAQRTRIFFVMFFYNVGMRCIYRKIVIAKCDRGCSFCYMFSLLCIQMAVINVRIRIIFINIQGVCLFFKNRNTLIYFGKLIIST